ncbi:MULTISPECIES: hypothetical protein [unclassified Novosphingobium]|uniref:hypothetical protein n=1 Tax=unclassified Novosphingobium TaxID=2644732 RepID=UPI00146C35DD|nr:MULTISPECIES: hypothetical protein [unclassified Novosphingobium]NMN03457.1 hypothetical protein [Novosphingobium sp. SG919]NMN86553.1 hypothetical protein [Novosphingobium sp. SG916]
MPAYLQNANHAFSVIDPKEYYDDHLDERYNYISKCHLRIIFGTPHLEIATIIESAVHELVVYRLTDSGDLDCIFWNVGTNFNRMWQNFVKYRAIVLSLTGAMGYEDWKIVPIFTTPSRCLFAIGFNFHNADEESFVNGLRLVEYKK